jgi:hypothetical protein
MSVLDDLFTRLEAKLSPVELKDLEEAALDITRDKPWIPTIGPQYDAFHSPADELFFGGAAGSSKTDLGLGLALTAHSRSLMRYISVATRTIGAVASPLEHLKLTMPEMRPNLRIQGRSARLDLL